MPRVTFKGNPLNLEGKEAKVGDPAPDFKVRKGLAPDSEYTLASDAGKVRLLSCVPSLDTGVCAIETKTLNAKAAELPDDVVFVTVSMDLPVAQERFCKAENLKHVVTVSDYYDQSFGRAYGIRVKELGLLARCIFVIDRNNKIAYKQLVPEIASEPNYDEAIQAAKMAAGK